MSESCAFHVQKVITTRVQLTKIVFESTCTQVLSTHRENKVSTTKQSSSKDSTTKKNVLKIHIIQAIKQGIKQSIREVFAI
jgi:hypothetical protein